MSRPATFRFWRRWFVWYERIRWGQAPWHEADEFILRPQTAKISATDEYKTLTCLAVGAQSYEWYEDGYLIEGETGGSLT